MCLARQLPLAISLAKKCPQVQFILEHCGVPDVLGNAFDPWCSHISELAAHSNVACKISGVVAYAQENWTVEDLRPWAEHVVSTFGWERIVWGTDWPVCTLSSSLKQWVESADQLFATATESQRDSMLYKIDQVYKSHICWSIDCLPVRITLTRRYFIHIFKTQTIRFARVALK